MFPSLEKDKSGQMNKSDGLNDMMKETIKVAKNDSESSSECSEVTPYQSLLDQMLEKRMKERTSERLAKNEKQVKFANSIKEQLIEKQRLKRESQEDLKKEQDKLLNQSKDYFCTIKDPKALMKSKKQNQRKILDLQVSEKIQRKLEETRNKVNIDSIIIRNAKNEIEEDKQKQDK